MKQLLCRASLLLMVALPMACSNDTDNNTTEDKRITIDAGNLQFSIAEAAFGADTEIQMRSAKPIIARQEVNLGESVEAEISIERDPAPAATRAPKPMSDGNYTIVAYKDGVRMEQQIKFTMSSGVMNITSQKKRYREVSQGSTYTFVCFNDKVQDNNNGTFTVSLANAETALIDKQSVTINNDKTKEVKFTMKHVGARVRTKLMAFTDITGVNATLGYQANKVSASLNYNMLTGNVTASTAKNATAQSATQSYTETGTKHDAALNDDLTTVTGNNYLTVLAGTKPEELVYNITAGTVYNSTLNTNGDRKLKAGSAFEANCSYTLTVRLMPSYLYLYEDGKTGHLKDADRQSHVPIAIVFDKVGKRAIALWSANGGATTSWYSLGESDRRQHNDVMYPNITNALQPAAAQGKHWTWDKSGSKDNTTIKAHEKIKYPAFYYAGKFYASNDLKSHLSGKTLSSNLNKDGVWYLPSAYEWKEVFVKLGFTDGSTLIGMNTQDWKGNLIHSAFVAANGASLIVNNYSTYYWSSSEENTSYVFDMFVNMLGLQFSYYYKEWNGLNRVRPFVAY